MRVIPSLLSFYTRIQDKGAIGLTFQDHILNRTVVHLPHGSASILSRHLSLSKHSLISYTDLTYTTTSSIMPLQRLPPISRAMPDSKAAIDQAILVQRRKTLQTISDLAPPYAASQGLARKSSRADSEEFLLYNSRRASLNNSKASRRKSLPYQMITSQHDRIENPPRIPAAYNLHQFPTESNHARLANRNSPKRRSMPSYFEPRGRSLSPVAEGQLSRQQLQGHNLQVVDTGRRSPRRKQSHSDCDTKKHKGGWNARRQRDLLKREQDFVEGNVQRERKRLGLDPRVPAKNAPMKESSKPKANVYRYYTRPFPSGQAAIVDENRREHSARDDSHGYGSMPNHRSFLDSGTSEMKSVPEFRRSLSITREPHSLSYNEVFNQTVASSMVSSPCNSTQSTIPAERYLSAPRSSSSFQTYINSTRSSSTKSNGSGISSTTKRSERVPLSHAQKPNHPLRQNPVLDKQNSPPALIGTSVDNSALLHPLSPSGLNTGSTHPRVFSVSQQSGLPLTCSLPHGLSRRPVPPQPKVMVTSVQEGLDTGNVLYRENPDKRGLVGRRLSRQGMGEAQKRAEREMVQERVKRANELEDARQKELVKEEKRKTQRYNGFLCGFFAM